MSGGKRRPTRWLYGLAVFMPILACLGASILVYQTVPELTGALEKTGITHLTQVVVPGSAEIYFPEAGAYAVYYEYRSEIDGVKYARGKYPPGLNCQLKSKATGSSIALVPDYVEGNVYTTQNPERAGVLIHSMSVEEPGVYQFSCRYSHGSTGPDMVLAVGPNIIWELFNAAARPLAAIVCGGFVMIFALGMSILIFGLVAYRRRQG